jgi:hypothetical protein
MTPHDHTTRVPGCYRCELGQDEAMTALVEERDELLAALAEAHRQLSRYDHKGPKQIGRALTTMERALGIEPGLDAAVAASEGNQKHGD